MNILLLYPFYNQENLIHNFSKKIYEKNIFIDSICVSNMEYKKCSTLEWPALVRIIFFMLGEKRNTGIWLYVRLLCYYIMLPILFNKYDAVDFHAYYPQYNRLMRKCKHNKVKFFITLWGSELMRADNHQRDLMRYGFDNCEKIKLTDSLFQIMTSYYSGVYDAKCHILYFGNSDLDVIDGLSDEEDIIIFNKLFKNLNQKTIVVCGYNAIPAQNHECIIEELRSVDTDILDKCHFVFPLTYGGSQEYKNRIRQLLNKYNFNYTIFESFLSDKEIAVLRRHSDIIINIQDTDSLACSLQDHLYCGGVCIIGEWLNYIPYERNNIFYVKTKKNSIADHFMDVFANIELYKERCSHNHAKIARILTWRSTLEKQALAYVE